MNIDWSIFFSGGNSEYYEYYYYYAIVNGIRLEKYSNTKSRVLFSIGNIDTSKITFKKESELKEYLKTIKQI